MRPDILALLAVILLMLPAQADSGSGNIFGITDPTRWDRTPKYRERHRHRHQYDHRPRQDTQYLYHRPHPPREFDDFCLPHVVNVMSDPHKTEDKSREDAMRRWEAKVEFSGGGGVFMDFRNAEDKEWRCSLSGAHDTAAGKISEFAGKALPGNDAGGRNLRCELWARPCRAARTRDSR